MIDESKDSREQKNLSELSEGDLSEVSGGAGLVGSVTYIHRGCGGRIMPRDFLGIPMGRFCSDCGEHHFTISGFDCYVKEFDSPIL